MGILHQIGTSNWHQIGMASNWDTHHFWDTHHHFWDTHRFLHFFGEWQMSGR